MNVFVFDAETIPDVEGGRRLWEPEDLSDKEVVDITFHKHRQEIGHELLPTWLTATY